MMLKYLYYFMTFLFIILTCILPCRNEVATNIPTTTEGGDKNSTETALTTQLQSFSQGKLFDPTLEMMTSYVQSHKRLKKYLRRFGNEIQRSIVETQITFCPFISFCKFKIRVYTSFESCCQPCKCKDCEGTGMCCPSILPEEMFNVTEGSNTKSKSNNTSSWKFKVAKNKEPACISKHLTVRPHEKGDGFLSISDCPPKVDQVLQYNCSRPHNKYMSFESFLPVSSNTSLDIFRNQYCAVCNGVAEEDMIFFRPFFACTNYIAMFQTEKEITEFLFSTDKCSLTFTNVDPRVHVSDCDYAISTCNVTGQWKTYEAHLELGCHAYESVFKHEQYLFRNVFCVMCNGMEPHTVTCPKNPFEFMNFDTSFIPFSGLLSLDFDDGFTTSKTGKTVKDSSCTRDQIFDALMERCKDLTCPDMRKLHDGNCINIYESINYHFSYIVKIRLEPTSPVTMMDAYVAMSDVSSHILDLFQNELDICNLQIMFKLDLKFGRNPPQTAAASSLNFIDLRITFAKSGTQKPWDIVDNLLKVHGRKYKVESENNGTMEYVVHVHDGDDRLFKIIKVLFDSADIHKNLMAASTDEQRIAILAHHALTDTNGLTLLPFLTSYNGCEDEQKEINALRYSSCPKVNMSKLDITWTETSDGLAVKDLKVNSTDFYYIEQDNIMICAETFERIVRHLEHQRVFDAEILLSIASCSFCIISLLFTLFIFSLFPRLRTPLPGKNTMSLVTALLMAQIMLLVGSLSPLERYSTSCKALGLLTHFSWLCSIFWMNVCTYHMFLVLTETKALVTGQGLKRFIRYHVYVIVMATVLVLANVISSVASSSGEIGYGGKFCYLTSQKRILFTFVIPTGMVIIANLFMFAFVVFKITGSPSIHKNVKHNRNNLVILVKLSTITGLTWVFGFVYTWTTIKAFSYIFIALNASQGVFIMFAFVINRRVLALFKDLKVRSHSSNHSKTPETRGDI